MSNVLDSVVISPNKAPSPYIAIRLHTQSVAPPFHNDNAL